MHVDWTGYRTAPAETRLSIDAGIPVVDLDLAGVALYAPTETGASSTTSAAPRRALAAGAELVVVIAGAIAAARTHAAASSAVPATSIRDPVSTLGVGDVFHGALLAALVWSSRWPRHSRWRTALPLSPAALDGAPRSRPFAELA